MEAWYIWVDNWTDSRPEIMNGTCPQWICIGMEPGGWGVSGVINSSTWPSQCKN
jgi:hypothetical protein